MRRVICGLVAGSVALAACGGEAGPGAREPVATREAGGGAGARLVEVGRFSSPVFVTAPPRDPSRLFVVEQGGRIWLLRAGRRLPEPFLDLSAQTWPGGERGLLSLAFAPDYARSGLLYVDYTDREGTSRIVEYRRAGDDADRADPRSARELIVQPQPEPNHNGGLLLFGPDDLLYVGFGDGGGTGDQHGPRGNAQSLDTLLGKILRIDPRQDGDRPYRIPADNPFVGRAGARGEIYAYGLRNPWRFSFDRRTGDLTIGDVGQDEVEELDWVPRGRGAGANFGWRVFEGEDRYAEGEEAPGAVPPVFSRRHEEGWCSITAGVVVRDPGLPTLAGRAVFGDFCFGRLVSARLGPGGARDVRESDLEVDGLSSFGEDAAGRVYAVSLAGPVYRLAPGG